MGGCIILAGMYTSVLGNQVGNAHSIYGCSTNHCPLPCSSLFKDPNNTKVTWPDFHRNPTGSEKGIVLGCSYEPKQTQIPGSKIIDSGNAGPLLVIQQIYFMLYQSRYSLDGNGGHAIVWRIVCGRCYNKFELLNPQIKIDKNNSELLK